MRNFVLAHELITSGAVKSKTAGFGLAYLDANGEMTFDDGTNVKDKAYFVLCRSAAEGGNVVLPFYKNKFRYTKSVYQAGATFSATFAISSTIYPDLDYTILIAKKGMKFNERNRWHATIHTTVSDTLDTVLSKLVNKINAITGNTGLSAVLTTVASNKKITFTANEAGMDYSILGADAAFDGTVTYVTRGATPRNDFKAIQDLADKAAANAGFEYTYMGDVNYLYPKYPLSAPASSVSNQYTVYNIFFAEPREVKTVDETINQIIQVAFDSGSFTSFDDVLDELL